MNLAKLLSTYTIILLLLSGCSKSCTYQPSLQDTYLLDSIEITINKDFITKYPQLSISTEDNSSYLEYVTCNTTFTIQELHIMPLDEYTTWIEQMVDGVHPIIYQQIGDYVLVGDPWDILSGQSLPSYSDDEEYNKDLDEYKEFLQQFPDEKFELIDEITLK